MSEYAVPALSDALALLRAPRGFRPGPEARLPEGVLILIRIVAGDEQVLEQAQLSTGESGRVLRDAAAFYIQQVMFAPGSHSYRVLGVESDASDERLRENYRWLVRWLHPDRNSDEWEAVYADRVNRAWQDVRTQSRRQDYDVDRSDLPESYASAPFPSSSGGVRASFDHAASPGLSLRWLPTAIFVGLGASAILTVSAFYILRSARPAAEATVEVPALAIHIPAPNLRAAALNAPVATEVATPSIAERVSASEPLTATSAARESVPDVVPVPVATPTRVLPAQVTPARKETATRSISSTTQMPPTAVANIPPQSRPVAQPAPEVPAEPDTPTPFEQDANRVLGRFSQAYEEGNLGTLRALFTADIRSPRGGQRATLAEYNRLFESSRERSLALRDVSWFASGEGFTIIASYQATVIGERDQNARLTHGDIRMDLRRVNDEWRIYRLQYDEQSG